MAMQENKILEMNNVRIVFRNFEGRQSKYNREGDRNFAIVIEDEDVVAQLLRDGWNVKTKAPKEEGDDPFHYLTVKVKYNSDRPRSNPRLYLSTGKRKHLLTEESVGVIDNLDIETASFDLRPYEWEVNGNTGITAYLVGGCVTQVFSRFDIEEEDED